MLRIWTLLIDSLPFMKEKGENFVMISCLCSEIPVESEIVTKSCPTIRRALETDDIRRIVNRKTTQISIYETLILDSMIVSH